MKTKLPKVALPPVLKLLCQALDDKKAEKVRVLHVSEQSSITDFLVVATGTSDPHLRALRVELEKVLDANRVHIVGMDTSQESGWVVIDAFDIMIHVLTPEHRERYALENLWKDATDLPVEDIIAEPKVAKPRAIAKPVEKAVKATKPAKAVKASPVAKTAAKPRKPKKS